MPASFYQEMMQYDTAELLPISMSRDMTLIVEAMILSQYR
jgi:hypothetical protein